MPCRAQRSMTASHQSSRLESAANHSSVVAALTIAEPPIWRRIRFAPHEESVETSSSSMR